jgi:hypothetical protein
MFLRIALRNLRREKLYAVLNIAGFALGIASARGNRGRPRRGLSFGFAAECASPA